MDAMSSMEVCSSEKEDETDVEYEEIIRDPCQADKVPFVPPTKRSDAPLAGILKPELEDIDPRRYFPDFKPSSTLRFSRVFAANSKPTLRVQIWWTSKTFKKDALKKKAAEPKLEVDVSSDGVSSTKEDKWALKIGPPPKPEECMVDDMELLCTPGDPFDKSKQESAQDSDDEEDAAPWRFGPAQIWYDRMGVPANPEKFNYGFVLKKTMAKELANSSNKVPTSEKDEDTNVNNGTEAFLPVDLLHWEDDIIIDSEEARKKIVADFAKNKLPACGWIPTAQTRTYKAFMTAFNQGTFQQMFAQPGVFPMQLVNNEADTSKVTIDSHHSIFPMDNYEFETTRWEENIIWDSENMTAIPEPRMLTLDYEDDPTIFGMPEDSSSDDKDGQGPKQKKETQFNKKKRLEMILMHVQQRQKQEEAEQMESTIAQIADKDPFNLSNDNYYIPKNTPKNTKIIDGASDIIHHLVPTQNICSIFLPRNLTKKAEKGEAPQVPKRVVTGTNADLRKLPLKEAKEICREYGLTEEEINSLSRWDIIHVIRTLSTQAAKARSDFTGMARFARGNIRFSDKENLAEKTIDDVPYSSSAVLSEAEKRKLEFEMEERERLDLQRMIRGEVTKTGSTVSKGAQEAVKPTHDQFFDDEEDRDEGFSIEHIGASSTNTNSLVQERRRQKRRLQDQLRRLNKTQAKVEGGSIPSQPNKQSKPKKMVEKKPPPPPKPSLLKMRCSACGETGHMKTNKYCRLYGQKEAVPLAMKTVGDICPTVVDDEELDVPTEELIAVEGTRLKISKKLYKHAEQERNKQKKLRLHIPRQFLDEEKKKRMAASAAEDELKKKKKKKVQANV